MLDTALAVCAGAWGLVMALSPLLQIRRMACQQSSRDVSIGYWGVLLVGFALWVAYGVAVANLALILPNAVAFCVGCLTIGVAVRYRRPSHAHSGRASERGKGCLTRH
jgi:MtN3 and saliva related transmembrane protein